MVIVQVKNKIIDAVGKDASFQAGSRTAPFDSAPRQTISDSSFDKIYPVSKDETVFNSAKPGVENMDEKTKTIHSENKNVELNTEKQDGKTAMDRR